MEDELLKSLQAEVYALQEQVSKADEAQDRLQTIEEECALYQLFEPNQYALIEMAIKLKETRMQN